MRRVLRGDLQAPPHGAAARLYVCLVPRKRLVDRVNYTVIVIALVVTAIDAVPKVWARHDLARPAVHIAGGIWLRLQYNSGISFSFNQSRTLITAVATLI